MIKNKISLYLIFISIFTTITGFILIVQKSYSNLVGPMQKIDANQVLNKIDPNIDTSIIKDIQNRPETIDTGEINFTITSQLTTPSPTKSQIPEPSVSPKINQTVSE